MDDGLITSRAKRLAQLSDARMAQGVPVEDPARIIALCREHEARIQAVLEKASPALRELIRPQSEFTLAEFRKVRAYAWRHLPASS